MCVGLFIALLDVQIVSASLREIGGGLSAGADEIAWVQTAYLIAEIIVIPLSGPILGTVGVMHFLSQWNDFVLPMIVMRDHAKLPVMVQLIRMSGKNQRATSGFTKRIPYDTFRP